MKRVTDKKLYDEYRALNAGPALVERRDRGLLEITGADRASWLHNLTTNEVKGLAVGEGQYTFALNLQGRILFDLNVLVRADSIWVDLDRRWSTLARDHFEKYTVIEDVAVADRSDDFTRFALVGKAVNSLLTELGASHAASMPLLASTEAAWGKGAISIFRDDFCGPFAVELLVPMERGDQAARWLTDRSRAIPAIAVGEQAVQIRRIEAGLPWPGREITEDYLPAETGQLDRAVSFRKGCYLGQEVVERMRSRDVVSRRLVGLTFEGAIVPAVGSLLQDNGGASVGVVTSACQSFAKNAVVGLAYVKTAASSVGTPLTAILEEKAVTGIVSELPFPVESAS